MISSSSAAASRSSITSLLFPIPGTPTRVTSCGERSTRTRANAPRSSARSFSLPTSGDDGSSSPGPETRPIASTASHTSTGSVFPFADTGSCSRYTIARSVARCVAAPTRIPSTGAAAWMRAAVFITSPATIDSPSAARASSVTSASPVATPTRTWRSSASPRSFSAEIDSRAASAARTARSGSSSWAVGAP